MNDLFRYFHEIGWAVQASIHEYHMHFKCFQVDAEDGIGAPMLDGEDGIPTAGLSPEDAFWNIRIDVKWDGCSNWETNRDCMVHFCRRDQMEELSALFVECYDWASETLKIEA